MEVRLEWYFNAVEKNGVNYDDDDMSEDSDVSSSDYRGLWR